MYSSIDDASYELGSDLHSSSDSESHHHSLDVLFDGEFSTLLECHALEDLVSGKENITRYESASTEFDGSLQCAISSVCCHGIPVSRRDELLSSRQGDTLDER